jgi:hypothetical protein
MPTAAQPRQELLDLAAQRFPLLPRPKPMCRSLPERIERVRHNAATAQQDQSLEHAAKALNLAALIYSDSAMPDAARELCWQQYDVFATHGPYTETIAKTAAQPLINIGRLHTRAGQGDTAYLVHQAMLDSAQHDTGATIDGRTVNLGNLAHPGDARHALVQALRKVLLSDGLRALCRAGRWTEAHGQAQNHHGVSERFLEGRQIAIIAAAITGNHHEAQTLIDTATATEPWEHCIAACLHTLTGNIADIDVNTHINAATKLYLTLDASPEHTLFLTRAGLTLISLAPGHDTTAVLHKLEDVIAVDPDAYPAAELLASAAALPLKPRTRTALTKTATAAGLEQPIPADLAKRLREATDIALHAQADSLSKV